MCVFWSEEVSVLHDKHSGTQVDGPMDFVPSGAALLGMQSLHIDCCRRGGTKQAWYFHTHATPQNLSWDPDKRPGKWAKQGNM